MFQAFALRPVSCRPGLIFRLIGSPAIFSAPPIRLEAVWHLRLLRLRMFHQPVQLRGHVYEAFCDGDSATEASLVRTRKTNVSWRYSLTTESVWLR